MYICIKYLHVWIKVLQIHTIKIINLIFIYSILNIQMHRKYTLHWTLHFGFFFNLLIFLCCIFTYLAYIICIRWIWHANTLKTFIKLNRHMFFNHASILISHTISSLYQIFHGRQVRPKLYTMEGRMFKNILKWPTSHFLRHSPKATI